MFQIRRRWPALTAVVAVGAYIFNNYSIQGLDQLSFESRSTAQIAQHQTSGDPWSTDTLPKSEAFQPPRRNDAGLPSTVSPGSGAFGTQTAMRSSEQFPINQFPDGLSSSASFPNAAQPQSAPQLSPLQPLNPFTSERNMAARPTQIAEGQADLGRMLSVGEKLAIWENKNSTSESSSGINRPLAKLRIASFHVSSLGATKLAKPHVFELLVQILRKFDVVALQGIQSSRDDILPLLLERLNQSGCAYDYLIGPRVGRAGAPSEQFAFVFDTQRLETDRFQLYTIEDPEDLITREPLVAWFRAKGVAPQQAFTFSLINIAIEPAFADRERAILPNLISAIENDGRGEDDWILMGDFAGGDAEMQALSNLGARIALIGVPTTTDGSRMLDDIVFSGAATVEFVGKTGAFDFLRHFNLSIEQALEVSDHLPVWAEFSALEGAEPGRIAPVAAQIH